jgi:uroporphyrinogen decarboxylase
MVDPEWTGPVPKFIRLSDGVTQDWLGHRRKIQSTVFGDVPEHCGYIWRDAGSVEEIKTIDVFKFPEPSWFDFSPMRAGLKQYSGYAVMASGASVFQHPTLIRGLDTFLCDLYSEPEIAQFIISRYTDFYLAYFDLMFSTLPGMIDILRIADDFGMQDRPLLSPELFRLYFKHRIAALCAMAHSHGVFVMFHSCGAVRDFIPDLIDAGVDILDPLQPRAAGMELSALKRDFGGQICFHGSIDTQETLPRGTPHDVADEARDRLSLFDKEAGFIIAPAHSVQPDAPSRTSRHCTPQCGIFRVSPSRRQGRVRGPFLLLVEHGLRPEYDDEFILPLPYPLNEASVDRNARIADILDIFVQVDDFIDRIRDDSDAKMPGLMIRLRFRFNVHHNNARTGIRGLIRYTEFLFQVHNDDGFSPQIQETLHVWGGFRKVDKFLDLNNTLHGLYRYRVDTGV